MTMRTRKARAALSDTTSERASTLTPWQLLDRFLVLGTEVGTYYATDQRLTIDQAQNALALVKSDGLRFVETVIEVGKSGRAPKHDSVLFALALASAHGDLQTRQAAFTALPLVCRTGTQLFQFVAEAEKLRGWGRGMRRAIADWYARADASDLTHQALRHQQLGGWSHRDLLRLAHPKPPTDEHRVLFKWIVDGELVGPNAKIEAFEQLRRASLPLGEARVPENEEGAGGGDAPADLIRRHRLTRDCVPTALLARPDIWEALLEDMPLTAMVRNLGNMTRCGLLTPDSKGTHHVVERLSNDTLLRRAQVHPLTLLIAHATYTRGQGSRGADEWQPVPKIVDALDEAFALAFQSVEPTDKRFVVAVDVSGSMSSATVAGSPLSACEAATAMALLTHETEASVLALALADSCRKLKLTPRMRLAEALAHTRSTDFGGNDCASPMTWAMKNRVEADVFVVYTDSAPRFGNVHPSRALADYRQRTGIGAKLIIVGMCAGRFSIADPGDPGMLDVVGFDVRVPLAMREFIVM